MLLVTLVGWGLIRLPHEIKRKRNYQKILSKQDVLENILMLSVFFGMILVPVIHVFSNVFRKWDWPFSSVLSSVGMILVLPSFYLFYRSHQDLGLNWSPTLEVRKGHELCTQGIYKKIRHPMYASIFLGLLAQFLLAQNSFVGFVGLISFGLLYFVRLPREENLMILQFGRSYQDYMKETYRLIPFIF